VETAPDGWVEWLFRVWSPVYDLSLIQRAFYRPVHARLLARVAGLAPRRVVDLGCGTAQLTDDLVRAFPNAQVVGVDLSMDMLRAAQARLNHETPPLLRANVYALPLATGSVDLVTSSISYHWYAEPARALAEVARVLEPGGRFALATVIMSPVTLSLRRMHLATPSHTREKLTAAGFSVERAAMVWPGVVLFECVRR
jgi:ubiquinone/menaquinone biosynthesis C-methylase UbiE